MNETIERKKLSTSSILAIGLGAVIGWSWIIYAGLWSTIGGSLGGIIAFVITGILCSMVGLVYAELTSAYPKSGGDVVFALEGIGTKSSIVVMWTMLVFWVGLLMIEVMMFPVILSDLGIPIPQFGQLYTIAGAPVYASYIIVSLLGNAFFAALNAKSIEMSGKLQTGAVYILLVAAVLLLFSGLFKGSVSNMQPLFTDRAGFFTVFLMLPGFMSGFNSIPQAAEEAKAEPKIIGRMVLITVWASVIFYLVIIIGTSLAASEAIRLGEGLVVLEALKNVYGDNQIVRLFVTFASLLGMLTTWNACYIAGSRLFIGLGKAKYLPHYLSKKDDKNGMPVNAIVTLCVASSVIAFIGTNRSIYAGIVNIFSFGLIIAWFIISIAFINLNKKRPDLERPYKVKNPKLVGWGAAIFSFTYGMLYMPFGSYGLRPGEWAVVGTVVVIALIVYFVWNKGKGNITIEERRRLLGLDE